MGSPVSPILCNCYMEVFEQKALSTALHPPSIWKRYVDDTFTKNKKAHEESFFNHINNQNDHIGFTKEDSREDGSQPFLDTLNKPVGNRLVTSVYRKPTHTDQYLHFDSHHPLNQKFGVVNTLFHRARLVCTNSLQLQEEEEHLSKALQRCDFPQWAINRSLHKLDAPQNTGQVSSPSVKTVSHITVPYMKGISESIKNICKKKGIQVHFKPALTIRNALVKPKDKDNKSKKCGAIYQIVCPEDSCNVSYVGETGRTLQERVRDHLQPPSAVHAHHTGQGHPPPSMDNVSILDREPLKFKRFIKESIYIRAIDPNLNKNIGKFDLPHVWDNVINKSVIGHNSNRQ